MGRRTPYAGWHTRRMPPPLTPGRRTPQPTCVDLDLRLAAMRNWHGPQSGPRFVDVVDVTGRVAGDYESSTLDVAALPELPAMVRTDEAPWAPCPTTGAGPRAR